MYCKNCGAQMDDTAVFCQKCGASQQQATGGGKATKYCFNCGNLIDERAELCPKCGVRQAVTAYVKKEQKEPWLAALASFLIPGLGQLYNGDSFFKAALIFCTSWLILPWIYGIYDAYTGAKKINEQG